MCAGKISEMLKMGIDNYIVLRYNKYIGGRYNGGR